MRYSYAWEMQPDEWPGLEHYSVIPGEADFVGGEISTGGYVEVTGSAVHCGPDIVTQNSGNRHWQEHLGYKARLAREGRAIDVYYPLASDAPIQKGQEVVIRGRVEASDWFFIDEEAVRVNATASRFHGASIAGFVVGAMGCFIFGLYLRRWLRERKALASEPSGDMIA